MGRRTSGQQVGLEKIGSVQANLATLTTTQSNSDLTIDPNGTGGLNINGDVTLYNQSDLRLREASANGTDYFGMQAAATMAASYTITWPDAVSASNGYVLSSDTNGVLSWVNPGGSIGITDPGSSATVHYPFFGTNAGSLPTSLTGLNAKTNLSFIPSTGILISTIGQHPTIQGTDAAASSGTQSLRIRGTSSATKNTSTNGSILMDDGVASSTTTTGTLVVTGGVGVSGQITATTVVETSSIAFKENINPINNALDVILQLMGVTYDRIDNKEHEAGLIAEHVYKIAPDLVSLDANGKPYGIKYTKISAYLIESIKTLKEEIAELQKGK